MILVLGAGAGGLRERHVEEHAADAGDVRMNPVEDPAALLVAIEALGDVIAEIAAGLGEADGQGVGDLASRGLGRVRVVAQPTHDVARGGEAQRLHLGIPGLVVELIEEAGLGLGVVAQLDGAPIDEGPLIERQLARLVGGAFADREPGARLFQGGSLVGELEDLEHAHARARHELLAHGLDDRLAIVGGERRGEGQPHVGARRIRVPARPHDGVALAQRKGIAEIGKGLGIVHALRAVGDVAEQHLATAVVHFVEDAAVAPGKVLRAQDEDVGRVLDLAAGVARRLVDQRDALVGGIGRIDFAACGRDHALIGADLAEGGAFGQRLDRLDREGEKHCYLAPGGGKFSSTPTPSGSYRKTCRPPVRGITCSRNFTFLLLRRVRTSSMSVAAKAI